jgi:hypothetical protein
MVTGNEGLEVYHMMNFVGYGVQGSYYIVFVNSRGFHFSRNEIHIVSFFIFIPFVVDNC